jgi:FkbH-like protein
MDQTRHTEEHYNLKVQEFMSAVWAELLASYRVLRPIDPVKLVVIDLDDTLWRGGPAEEGVGREPREGWPLGFAEALLYLKKRGVLLGIISKNDEAKVAAFWDEIYKGYIRMSDFAVKKINWKPKAENMNEMLIEANLLPQSVVFIDDSPVERAAMSEAFPEMRVLGQYPYYLRRILLWSAETQVPQVTDESARRTQMMQAQVAREESRQRMSRGEFLVSLNLKVNVEHIGSFDAREPRMARALELLNKTNQFNTTGARWTPEQMIGQYVTGATLYTFEVADKFTNYGIVGVAVVAQNRIRQLVMSCRVVGMDVELAVVPLIESCLVTAGYSQAIADFVETPSNLLCRDLYEKCGYAFENGAWSKPLKELLPVPAHITLTAEQGGIPQTVVS